MGAVAFTSGTVASVVCTSVIRFGILPDPDPDPALCCL